MTTDTIRTKNVASAQVERLALKAHAYQTAGKPCPPGLALALERARRQYDLACLAMRRRQHARTQAVEREAGARAVALVGKLWTVKGRRAAQGSIKWQN